MNFCVFQKKKKDERTIVVVFFYFFSVYTGYFGMELITQTKLPRDGHRRIWRQSEDKMLAYRCYILFVITKTVQIVECEVDLPAV